MADADRLLVIRDQQLVGLLSRHTRGRVAFQYSREWLDGTGRPVSLSLPCRPERFAPGISTAFFENLLPENSARRTLAFNHRFDHKDTFAFLEKFGEDCAGALSIIPDDAEPVFTPGQYQCVDKEIAEALDNIRSDPGKYSLFPAMKTARFSIAG